MPWERLIRFEDVKGVVRFGEPILGADDSTSLDEIVGQGQLEARCWQGTNIFSLSPPTEKVKVKLILGILSPGDVPIVKCIGLNYMKHSMMLQYN